MTEEVQTSTSAEQGSPVSIPFWRRGLWLENPALVQLLGLCPLLAVTTSVVNAIGLGAATMFALLVLRTSVSATKRWVQPDVRLPVYVLILASAVTVVDLAMHAWAFELHERLGIFVPLIVTNCLVITPAYARYDGGGSSPRFNPHDGGGCTPPELNTGTFTKQVEDHHPAAFFARGIMVPFSSSNYAILSPK